jgi:ubiquinone/menaquinone biosynthesis C-methylase UbiE
MNRIKSYFNKKAGDYEAKRKEGVLGKMVSREMRAAMEMLDIKKSDKILDCGCGTGAYGKLVKDKGGRYLGIDISQKMVKEARRNGLDARLCAMENFQSNKKFDKILISGSLEFCKDPERAFKRCVKNLKKGGLLVIIAPRLNLPGLFYQAYYLIHGVRISLFSRKKLSRLMREAGLQEDEQAWSKPNPLAFILSGRKSSSS